MKMRCRQIRMVLGFILMFVPLAAHVAVAQDADDELPGMGQEPDDFLDFDAPPAPLIDRLLTVEEMHQVATAASALATKTQNQLKIYRRTLRGWANSPPEALSFPEYVPQPLLNSFAGQQLSAVNFVSAYIELLTMQILDLDEIAARHHRDHAPVLDDQGEDERLQRVAQTQALYEIKGIVSHCVRSHIQTLDLVVDGKMYEAHRPLITKQRELLDQWRAPYEADLAAREAAGGKLSEDEKIRLALESRAPFADAEKQAVEQFSGRVETVLGFLDQEYSSFGNELLRWIADCPFNLPPLPGQTDYPDTFFEATARILGGAVLEPGEGMQPVTADIGAWWGVGITTFFHVSSNADTTHAWRQVTDFSEGFKVFYELDGARKDSFLGGIDWINNVVFPNLAVPKYRPVGPNPLPPFTEPAPRTGYPDLLLLRVPSIRGIRLFGEGIPRKETNDWSWLVPQPLCVQHNLNGYWIVMVVHGNHLFDLEGRDPEIIWAPADRHLKYVLLSASKYGAGNEWNDLWKQWPEESMRGQDCYILGVQLRPETWAGDYWVKFGDLTVNWTLPHATNRATTRFVHKVGAPDDFEAIRTTFPGTSIQLEIRTTAETPTADKIPFQLLRSDSEGNVQLVQRGTRLKDTILWAYRTGDPKLFRSGRIAVNGVTGERLGDTSVGMQPGQLLAARILPHSVVRQDGAVAITRMLANPAAVGASWDAALREAANVAGVKPPKPWDRMTRTQLTAIARTQWTTVDSTTYVRIGGREILLRVGDLAAMLMIRAEFIRQMEATVPRLKKLHTDAKRGPSAAFTARALLRPEVERVGSPLGAMEVRYRQPREFITDRFAPFRRAYDDAWIARTFGGIKSAEVAWQNEATLDILKRYAAAAEQTLLEAKAVKPKDAEALLRLTAIGMGPIARQLKPSVQRQVTVENVRHYEVDRVARGYLGTIQQLGAEFVANEALIDQYNARLALVAAGISMMNPATIVERVLSAAASTATLAATLTVEFPEYLARKRDLDFAIGAFSAIGPERYAIASMREKPGWAVMLELAGGTLDCAIALGRLATAGRSMAVLSDAEIADALTDPRFMSELTRRGKGYLVARVIELGRMRAAGTALEAPQLRVLERALNILDDAGVRPALQAPEILIAERAVAEASHALTANDGTVLVATVRYRLEVPGILVCTEHGRLGSIGTTGRTGTLRDMGSLFDQSITVERFALVENQSWKEFLVGDRIGLGSFLAVYELTGDELKVLKVARNIADSETLIARIKHCVQLMGDDIPQLAIHDAKVVDGIAVVVQKKFVPSESSYMLERAFGHIGRSAPTGTEIAEAGTVIGRDPAGPLRTLGICVPDSSGFTQMTRNQTKAICTLYQKFIDKGLVWYDGHLANIVFETEGTELIAKVIDQDFIWKWERSMWSGPVGQSMGNTLEEVYRVEQKVIRNRLQSMLGARLPDRAEVMLRRGQHLYPDAEYFMFKMLEFHGYINYVRGHGFVDGAMKLSDVLELLPNMRRRMDDLVDPDLHRLVQPRGRRRSSLPESQPLWLDAAPPWRRAA